MATALQAQTPAPVWELGKNPIDPKMTTNKVVVCPPVLPSLHRAEWMHQGTFGVMVHYLIAPPGADDSERKVQFDRIVDGFDLEAFMKQFDATGADWLIFTIGQNTGYYCSPNRLLDRILPGHTSKRNLVSEIAHALKTRKKHCIVYLPAEVSLQSGNVKRAFSWNPSDFSVFQERYGEFIKDYSLSFGFLVDGWWMDGCWIEPKRFGDWQTWMSAFRAGNTNAAVAVSPGPAQTPMTALQDYLAGETYKIPAPAPSSRFVSGVQWHALLPIDCTFTGGQPHNYADEVLFNWVLKCKAVGGAVTLNVPFSQKGQMREETVAQLSRLAAKISQARADK